MRTIITVGLGFGDEGKGATVDYLTRKHGSKLTVRYSGGCQAGHNVELPNGHRHCFSQFGAGMFAGLHTHLAQPVIIDPLAMRNEALALAESGFHGTFDFLTVHPQCLVSTPLHKAVNIADVDNIAHGTCGMGIGVARKYWLAHGQDAIFADDLKNRARLEQKLSLFSERHNLPRAVPINAISLKLVNASGPLRLYSTPEFFDHGVVIFEGAQGLLIDQAIGCHPYTTWSDVTPRHAIDLAESWGADQIEVLGITRAYMTRHGNGPLPTETRDLNLTDPGNPEHPYQGRMRFGHLDLSLLAYAASKVQIDGLVVNCLDHIAKGVKAAVRYRSGDIWAPVFDFEPLSVDELLEQLEAIAPVKITADGPTWENRKEV